MAKVKALSSAWGSPEEADEMQAAAWSGDEGVVAELLRQNPGLVGAEKVLDEKSSGTPLHIASSRGHFGVVSLLVSREV